MTEKTKIQKIESTLNVLIKEGEQLLVDFPPKWEFYGKEPEDFKKFEEGFNQAFSNS